jgi:hypothetical protein
MLLISLGCGGAAAQRASLDSLELERLRLAVQGAGVTVRATDLLHRLTPRLTLSATLASRDQLLFDPAVEPGSFQPRGALRITATLSLNDLFESQQHELALVERSQKLLDLESERARQSHLSAERARRSAAFATEMAILEEERELCRKLERFYTILFEEGKAQFDALANTRIRVLELSLRQEQLRAELRNIQEK